MPNLAKHLPWPALALCVGSLCLIPLPTTGKEPSPSGHTGASYLGAAARALQQNDLARASAILENGLDQAGESVDLLAALADVQLQRGHANQAAMAAERALALDPEFVPAHVLLGDIYREMGWLEMAADSYRRALALDPAADKARYRLVQCLAGAGLLRAAEQECREFLAAVETVRMYLTLGEVLEKSQRPQEALAAYDRALELEPQAADAHSRRAGLLCGLGEYDEAARASEAALAIDPDHAEAHRWLGLASAHRQDYLNAYGHAVRAEQAGLDMSAVWVLLEGHPTQNVDAP